jgi:hypothetical protein
MCKKTHKKFDCLRTVAQGNDLSNQQCPEAHMTREDACGKDYTTENDTTHAKVSFGHFGRTCDGGADLGEHRPNGTERERVRRHRHDPGRAIAADSGAVD